MGQLLSTRSVMLNLIPYNDTTEVIVNKAFKAPSFEAVDAFQAVVVSKEKNEKGRGEEKKKKKNDNEGSWLSVQAVVV